jgi:putative YhbY family RNA-binding protein
MISLTPAERRALRARAHALHPVVAVGHQGLTPAVVREIDVALTAHELIKIRVHDDDRDVREDMLARVCTELAAAPVQHLGKLLIVFRPTPATVSQPKRQRAPVANDKPSGTTRRKPRAPDTGGKGAAQSSRQHRERGRGKQPAGATKPRTGLARSPAGARSNEFSPRGAPAIAPDAPRRRRRAVVIAATHDASARNEPAVRRRRKNF